jgi:hypothetical protein
MGEFKVNQSKYIIFCRYTTAGNILLCKALPFDIKIV